MSNYTFVKAICLGRSIGSQWNTVDISQVLVYDLYGTYSQIYLVLKEPITETEVYVDMNAIRGTYSNYQKTLNELLIENNNNTLPTVSSLPTTDVKYARYSDAYYSGYKIDLANIGQTYSEVFPKDFYNDLIITRPNFNTDIQLLNKYCLISVNGYYHDVVGNSKTTYIKDGGISGRISGNNNVGILSFLDVGEVTRVPITNIYKQNDESSLKERIYFNIEEEIENKSVFLVLGGYLVFPEDNVFWRNGDKSFALNLQGLDYIERLMESNKYIDLSSLQLQRVSTDKDQLNLESTWSDDTITKYLKLSQSFLVIVDTPRLLTNKLYIRHACLPGMFTCYQEPKTILVVGYGKTAEYWKTYEDGVYSVNVQDSYLKNYILSQQPQRLLVNVNDNLTVNKPYYYSHGHLLEIIGYSI